MRIGGLAWRRGFLRWLRGPLAVLAAVPLLSLGLVAGAAGAASAAASGAGIVTIYPGIGSPVSITAGPDGALWFTNHASDSIGRITTGVTPAISGFTPAASP